MPLIDLSTPPSRGLSRLRRNHGDSDPSRNNSTNSLVSSSNSDDPNGDSGVGLRPVTSGGIGKLTDRIRRKSIDDRRSSADAGKRLSSLLSGRKHRLKRAKSSELGSSNGNADGSTLALPGNQSDSSLAQEGSGRSSLLTDDNSDPEE